MYVRCPCSGRRRAGLSVAPDMPTLRRQPGPSAVPAAAQTSLVNELVTGHWGSCYRELPGGNLHLLCGVPWPVKRGRGARNCAASPCDPSSARLAHQPPPLLPRRDACNTPGARPPSPLPEEQWPPVTGHVFTCCQLQLAPAPTRQCRAPGRVALAAPRRSAARRGLPDGKAG